MTEIRGILGEKLGMTQIFQDTRAIPVTVIQAGPCVVAQVKTKANDGYDAVQLVFGKTRPRSVTKPTCGVNNCLMVAREYSARETVVASGID